MSKYSIWLVVIALFVGVIVGFVVERQRAIDKMEAAKLSFQNQLNAVKTDNQKLMMENRQLQMSLTPTPTEGVIKVVTPTLPIKQK